MAHDFSDPTGLYAIVGEFDDPDTLMKAAEEARFAGYKEMDAYTPFPVHGMSEAIGFRDSKVPWTVIAFGIIGLTCGYTLQFYTSVIDYPMNVGGKPLNSIPSFIPVSYECTILFSAFSAAIGMFIYNKLPMPYHPIFNAKNFERASQDRFFLAIEAADPSYDEGKIEKLMREHGAVEVSTCDY
ncbi:MAG: DUF3341 domain-containing protein [Armatimonadetes bacterium]|nr:DUF3341 domain-containing protein [Armatimonadota bacterium]